MKRLYTLCAATFLAATVLSISAMPEAKAAGCTATGFVRDSINLTAAQINPPGTVSGEVDATGCNIGIYYGPGKHGAVKYADVHGANYFGIVNNGANVDISHSTVRDIGETPLNGSQHGIGIYYAFATSAQGDITDNVLWNYQKGGIVVNGSQGRIDISHNRVLGEGPVSYIAQNGIQVGYGAKADVTSNFVSGNSYTGSNIAASGGIIVVGGDCEGGPLATNINVAHNTAIANDVGVWFANYDASCNPPTTPTRNSATDNTIWNNSVNNTSGDGAAGLGYQAGIVDTGDKDTIEGNRICGAGYTPVTTPPPYLYKVDVTFTNHPEVNDNSCHDREYNHFAAGHPAHHHHKIRPNSHR